MSLRKIIVQYVGDTLYLPPLEREVNHIIVGEYDAKDWEHFEPVVRCRDCNHYKAWMQGAKLECWANGEPFSVEPSGFCAWGERVSE